MEQNDPMKQGSHSERISQLLDEWLSQREWQLAEAYDWLQGYALPPVGHDDYPFVWIYRGLVLISERYEAETELARRLATVLREKPDVIRPGTRPNELLFNLLMLCGSLSYPKELGEPLLAVYERRALGGEWLGTDLRVALTAALISNQIDKRLKSVWESMVEGQGDDFLIGNMKYGLDGIALMPPSESVHDEPALAEIGSALKAISVHLNEEPDRRMELGGYINEIVNTYPGRPSWNRELVCLADQHKWPDWAVVTLPSLCVLLDERSSGQLHPIFLWETYLPIISELGFKPLIEDRLCENKVLLLSLPNDALYLIEPFACVLEKRRLNTPLPSYSAVLGAVTDMMSGMEKILPEYNSTTGSASIAGTHETLSPIVELMRKRQEISKGAGDLLVEARREILPKNRAGVKAAAGAK